jgi:paraquat-inducible protein B
MSKKASSTAIGAFVVGGIALLAAAVAIFGGQQLFADKSHIVAYFEGSTKGLRSGSNVTFRGVRIGYVSDIRLLMEVDTLKSLTEVEMTIMSDEMALLRDGKPIAGVVGDAVHHQTMLDAGLSAQLDFESLVTGQLLVNLDFRPELKPQLSGLGGEAEEVPTVPTSAEIFVDRVVRILEKLDKLDLDKLVADVEGAVSGANELMNSKELRESIAGVDRLVNAPETQALAKKLTAAIEDMRATLDRARSMLANADARLEPALAGVGPALDQFNQTLAAARATLESANQQIRSDSDLSFRLERTLGDVSDAARSLSTFLDMLERNPEALIRGKQ